MPSYLITGASRGLGLGFVTELLKDKNNTVLATARNTAGSAGLQELKAKDPSNCLLLIDLDVASPESVNAAAKAAAELLPSGLDNLIHNAGATQTGMDTFEEMNLSKLTSEVGFTIAAPILLVRAFLPLIRKGETKRIVAITSTLGSIQNAAYTTGCANGYSVARGALNMLVRKWSSVLKAEGVTFALLEPGWVKTTEIGRGIEAWMDTYAPDFPRTALEEATSACMKVVNGLTIEDSGEFYSLDGTKCPF